MPGKHPSREMTHLRVIYDERRAVDVSLDFSTAFQVLSHNILTEKSLKYKLGEGAVRWVGHWLNCQAQQVVISGTVLWDASH